MSDEFKNSTPNQGLSNSAKSDSEDKADINNSVIDDPEIMASLQQLAVADSVSNDKAAEVACIQTPEHIKNIVEAAILAANKVISPEKIQTLFSESDRVDRKAIRQAIEQLMQDYQGRGVELIEVSSGFRFQVVQSAAPWVSRLWEEKPQKYSRALLETLALVAYRQPITRGEIEQIRGVSVSSQIMRTLVEREWVRIIGHRDVPGKPAMYATTRQFLDYFGLKKLDELPALSEIRDLDIINAELDFGVQSDNNSDSEQSNSIDRDKQESSQQNDSSHAEQQMMEESDCDERVDINVELDALRETYKQIDSIAQQNAKQTDLEELPEEQSEKKS